MNFTFLTKAQVPALVAPSRYRSVVSSFGFKDWTREAAVAGGDAENSEEAIKLMPSEKSLRVLRASDGCHPCVNLLEFPVVCREFCSHTC